MELGHLLCFCTVATHEDYVRRAGLDPRPCDRGCIGEARALNMRQVDREGNRRSCPPSIDLSGASVLAGAMSKREDL